MSTTIAIESGRTEIAQIVSDVFLTMLNLEIAPLEESQVESASGLTATVQFLGESKGAVMLHCSTEQAIDFTARMIGEPPESLNDDVRDVLGELANVVGGNLKSLFSPGVALSLPLVADGQDYGVRLCEAHKTMTVGFNSQIGVFHVSLVKVIPDESMNQ